MTMQTSVRPAKRIAFIRAPDFLVIAVCAAVVLSAVLRFVVGRDLPLGMDEAWTGAIVGQETFRATIQESLRDANAPLYFILMHFWTKLFGLSDAALRFPSFAFGAIAPLIALVPTKGIDRNVRLLWCGLAALWIPAIEYSELARCYTLAFFLAMACTLAYVRLLTRPGMRTAAGWALLGSLAILTHYHALLLVGCQGIGYLAVHRAHALRMWPAALLYVPAFAWIAVHAPRLLQYANPGVTFFSPLNLSDVFVVIAYFVVADVSIAIFLLLIGVVLGVLAWQSRSLPKSARILDPQSDAWLAASASAIAMIATISIGVLWPNFLPRYLMVFMPGVLLGFALATARFGRRWAWAPVAMVLLFGIFAGRWGVNSSRVDAHQVWSFEDASRELAEHGVDRLVFLFVDPVTEMFQSAQLEALGGFFFKRKGLAIAIVPVFLHSGEDPNVRLLAEATTPRSGILWIYDLSMRDTLSMRETAAASHPPRIERIDHAWFCSNFENGPRHVVACHRG